MAKFLRVKHSHHEALLSLKNLKAYPYEAMTGISFNWLYSCLAWDREQALCPIQIQFQTTVTWWRPLDILFFSHPPTRASSQFIMMSKLDKSQNYSLADAWTPSWLCLWSNWEWSQNPWHEAFFITTLVWSCTIWFILVFLPYWLNAE